MFRVIANKIYFRGQEIAKFEPWLRETVKQDASLELDGHMSCEQVEQLIARIHRLEDELALATADQVLKGASW